MKVPTSFASQFASVFSQRASRLLVRLVFIVLAVLTVWPAASHGWAQSSDLPNAKQEFRQVVSGQGLYTEQENAFWSEIGPVLAPEDRVIAKHFPNEAHGWVVFGKYDNSDGIPRSIVVASTQNGGGKWEFNILSGDELPELENISGEGALYFANDMRGWLLLGTKNISSNAACTAVLLTTEDAGATWHELPAPPAKGRLAFSSEYDGLLVGGARLDSLWTTHDGGTTWHEIHAEPEPPCDLCQVVYYGIPHLSQGHTWSIDISIISSTTVHDAIAVSGDDGESWRTTKQVIHRNNLMVSEVPSESALFSIGGSAELLNPEITAQSGTRIMAQAAGAYVRDAGLDTILFTQDGGVHGTVEAAPKSGTAGGFTGNWWEILWDAEPPNQNNQMGWSADSVIALAPTTGDVAKPSFSNSYYSSSSNIFWESGYAPSSISPPNPQLGSALGNCTWYAFGRLLELGANQTTLSALHGNAGLWATEASTSGISVDTTPTVHSIAELDPNSGFTAGHVAVVESVNADGTITVTESSYDLTTSSTWDFLWRHRTVPPTWFSHFIHGGFNNEAQRAGWSLTVPRRPCGVFCRRGIFWGGD